MKEASEHPAAGPPPALGVAAAPGRLAALVAVALGGGALGGLDALRVIAGSGARYASWTARLVLASALAYATLALALGIVALTTLALARLAHARRERQPQDATALAIVCGALAPLCGYILWSEIRLALLAPLAAGVAVFAEHRAQGTREARRVPRDFLIDPGSVAALCGAALAACWAVALTSGVELSSALGWSVVLSVAVLVVAALGVAAFGRDGTPRMQRVQGVQGVQRVLGATAALIGTLGWVVALRTPPPTKAAASAAGSPNILLVTVDTLRADHVGAYGSAQARTPNMDALAATGSVFEDASAQSYVTGPSHTTMLFGLLPPEHGALANGMRPSNDLASLPEWLSGAGYDTAGCIAGFTLVDRSAGLAERFDWYDDDLFAWQPLPGVATRLRLVGDLVRRARARGRSPERIARGASEVVDASLAWLDRRNSEAPFFLWTHFYDPHVPYAPPLAFDPHPEAERVDWYELSTAEREALVADQARFDRLLELYDAEIAYADAELGRLLAELELRGLDRDLVVVLTSDHGESLGEHGTFFDHVALYQTELAVPLIVRLPPDTGRDRPRRIAAPVRHTDLAPTLLELAGARTDAHLSGTSLVPLLEGGSAQTGALLAFGLLEGEFSGYTLNGTQSALRRGSLKLVRSSEHWLDSRKQPRREELFDLSADPAELNNLLRAGAASTPAELAGLRAALDFWQERLDAGSAAGLELDDDVLEELRRLGYL